MKITQQKIKVQIGQQNVQLARNDRGIMQVWAEDHFGLAAGLGFAHAHDRMTQLMLVREAGKGRLCETMFDTDDALEVDIYMRELGFNRFAENEVASLPDDVRSYIRYYAEGINTYIEEHGIPFEFKLMGYKPEPWTVADSTVIFRIMSYMGLAETQGHVEKWIIQALRSNVDQAKLKDLFSPYLNTLDEETIEALKKAEMYRPLIPDSVEFLDFIPRVNASNNWVLGPEKTTTGSVIQCNDPHLEINRMPSIWYEWVGYTADNYYTGITVPGIPGNIMGRNKDVTFGNTYGYMDQIDYFVEKVEGGRCARESGHEDVEHIHEIIHRKKKSDVEIQVWQNDLGLIDVDPRRTELKDGYYFNRAWVAYRDGTQGSFSGLYNMMFVKNVTEAQVAIAPVTFAGNWLMGDNQGNIGYQQSGLMPKRNELTLYPKVAWKNENLWQGREDPANFGRITNPKEGYIATANEFRNKYAKVEYMNISSPHYRALRINQLLKEKSKFSLDDLKDMQGDLISSQAIRYMAIFRTFLPDTPEGMLLKNWNGSYDRNSKAAVLFNNIYQRLIQELIIEDFVGSDVWHYLVDELGLPSTLVESSDRVFFGETPNPELWFKEGKMLKAKALVLDELAKHSVRELPTWGEERAVYFKNILFQGKLPKFVGYDLGPYPIDGNVATIVQGGYYWRNGRIGTFCPSHRYITDMATDETWTQLPGGPSDRRFSDLYSSDMDDFMNYRYKKIKMDRSELRDQKVESPVEEEAQQTEESNEPPEFDSVAADAAELR